MGVVTGGGGGGGGSTPVTDGTLTGLLARVPSGTLADLGGGTVGLGLVAQLLGPFALDTSKLTGTYQTLTDLPDGSIIFGAWPVLRDDFTAGGASDIVCSIYVSTGGIPPSLSSKLGQYTMFDSSWPAAGAFAIQAPLPSDATFPDRISLVGFAQHSAQLTAVLQKVGGTPSGGAADIYAAIASPTT